MLKGGGFKANKFAFTPVVTEHSPSGIKIAINFDQPEALSVSGEAGVMMDIKEVSIFKTQATMKSMSTDSFKGGLPKIGGALPPIIADKKEATEIEDKADRAAEVMDMFNSGNFLLMLILGGSMQELWGMIRAVQMMALSALVNIKIPINMFIYLQVCILFA